MAGNWNLWKTGHQVATLPGRPLGRAAVGAADAVDAATPIAAMIGDQMVDASSEAITKLGSKAVGELAKTGGQALTDAGSGALASNPYTGWLAPLAKGAGTFLSQNAGTIAEMGGKMATGAAKMGGRAAMGLASQGLREGARVAGGVYPANPETERANFARTHLASAPIDRPKMGGLPTWQGAQSTADDGPSFDAPKPTANGQDGNSLLIQGADSDVRVSGQPPPYSPPQPRLNLNPDALGIQNAIQRRMRFDR